MLAVSGSKISGWCGGLRGRRWGRSREIRGSGNYAVREGMLSLTKWV